MTSRLSPKIPKLPPPDCPNDHNVQTMKSRKPATAPNAASTPPGDYPQIIPKSWGNGDCPNKEKSRKSKTCGSLHCSEGDGTRTRNHRIDSPVL